MSSRECRLSPQLLHDVLKSACRALEARTPQHAWPSGQISCPENDAAFYALRPNRRDQMKKMLLGALAAATLMAFGIVPSSADGWEGHRHYYRHCHHYCCAPPPRLAAAAIPAAAKGLGHGTESRLTNHRQLIGSVRAAVGDPTTWLRFSVFRAWGARRPLKCARRDSASGSLCSYSLFFVRA